MTTVLDRFRLDDKVAIVTGASSGLGVAFAQALAEARADLAGHGGSLGSLARLATFYQRKY